MCKEKTPTILVSKMCPFAFYTTHTVRFSPHISNRFTVTTTVISETARRRSRLKVVWINLVFALCSYPTENTFPQLQGLSRPDININVRRSSRNASDIFRLVLTDTGKFSVNRHKKARPSGTHQSLTRSGYHYSSNYSLLLQLPVHRIISTIINSEYVNFARYMTAS